MQFFVAKRQNCWETRRYTDKRGITPSIKKGAECRRVAPSGPPAIWGQSFGVRPQTPASASKLALTPDVAWRPVRERGVPGGNANGASAARLCFASLITRLRPPYLPRSRLGLRLYCPAYPQAPPVSSTIWPG